MKKIISVISALSLTAGLAVAASAANYLGDADKNGTVNSADALAILEYSVGKTTEIDVKFADINKDKEVNSADALEALRISVGEIAAEEIKEEEPEKNPLDFSKAEIIEFYNKAITDSRMGKVKVTNTENVSITINSITGGNLVKSIANGIVESYAKPTTATKTFVNGKCDSETLGYFSACSNIDADGVAKAEIKKSGNGYEVTITVVSEKSSLGTEPKYNAQCSRPLDIGAVDLKGIKVTKADFNYSGTVLKAVIDENGKVISTNVTMPLTVVGEGSLGIKVSVDASGIYTNNSVYAY